MSITLAALLMVCAACIQEAYAQSVRMKYFNVERDGNTLVITWETELEESVRTYEIFRKAGLDADFVSVGTVSGHGVNLQYRLVDDQVYKGGNSAFIDYRLEVIYDNGVRQRLAEKKVNYTSTAIRRSWGSIKAMFQD